MSADRLASAMMKRTSLLTTVLCVACLAMCDSPEDAAPTGDAPAVVFPDTSKPLNHDGAASPETSPEEDVAPDVPTVPDIPPETDPAAPDDAPTTVTDAAPEVDEGGPTAPDVAPETSDKDDGGKDDGGTIPFDPDAPCQPDCADRECGSDGCGGICGYCVYPLICNAGGKCTEICYPSCEGKECGSDGCGGSCGECPALWSCGLDFVCHLDDCPPQCDPLQECGDDKCGGSCGFCSEPHVCESGLCILGPCGEVTSKPVCDGDVLWWCEDKTHLKSDDCAQFLGYGCSFDPWLGHDSCMEKPICTPACEGKLCGPDGCGGACGTCTPGWSCVGAKCIKKVGADCGSVTKMGECDGDVLWFCAGTALSTINCAEYGQTCGWVNATTSFDCK